MLVDLLGSVVKVVAVGEYGAGHHEVELSAKDLPTGVYFYRIVAGKFVDVRKMMVVR